MTNGLSERVRELYSNDVVSYGSGLDRLGRMAAGRMARARNPKVGTDGVWMVPGMGGRLYQGGGEDKPTRNPYKRWGRKVKRVWRSYTDFGNPLRMWEPIAAGIGAKIFRSIETNPEERHGLFEDISGGIVTILRNSLERYAHYAPYQIMPALRLHLSAAEGSSILKHIYVYYNGGVREPVIYLSGGEKPENDILRKNIEYAEATGKSPYEDDALPFKRKIAGFFDTQDGPPVLDVATLFDYSNYFSDEPEKAHRWAVKDDSWLGNQFGGRDSAAEAALPADLQNKVRIYQRPVGKTGFWYTLGKLLGDESERSGKMWREWVVKKPLIYAGSDLLLEPLETAMEMLVPPETQRTLIYEKARGISKAWRGMTNPKAPYLWYG